MDIWRTYSERDLRAMRRNEIARIGKQAKKEPLHIRRPGITLRERMRLWLLAWLRSKGWEKRPWMDCTRRNITPEVAYNMGYHQGEEDERRRAQGLPIELVSKDE